MVSMTKNTTNEIVPGNYQFRPNPFTPWRQVHVFKDVYHIKNAQLRARWNGIEIDAAKLVNRGQWKAV